MHNPIKDSLIFRHDWIHYKKVLPLNKYDQLICYTDPSFKSTTANDYKASRFWGKIGTEFHLIDCYVRQDTVGGMVRWLYNLYESLPEDVTVSFFMEANFLQDTILDEFTEEGNRRGYQLPITGDKRKKPDKLQRIEAISPLWERGFVFYNEALKDSPDMEVGIEQTLSLERGSRVHDDAPDADEAPSGCSSATQGKLSINRGLASVRPLKTVGKIMIRLFRDLIFAWRYKRAVKEAILLSQGSGLKYYVLYMNGGFKVVPKQTVKTLVKRHRFKKGTKVEDIERRALFVTK